MVDLFIFWHDLYAVNAKFSLLLLKVTKIFVLYFNSKDVAIKITSLYLIFQGLLDYAKRQSMPLLAFSWLNNESSCEIARKFLVYLFIHFFEENIFPFSCRVSLTRSFILH